MSADINRTIEAVWRMESAAIIGGLTRLLRDMQLAEEIAQEALVQALESWPKTGIPDNPGAWLNTVSRRKGIDALRRSARFAEKRSELEVRLKRQESLAEGDDFDIGDNLLGLMCMTCSPLLSREARVALTLKILGGLTVPEIARAFVVPESTIIQRVARARNALREANVEFKVPNDALLAERLPSVLDVIYLIFNEGYAATDGPNWMRPGLCQEALRLGRILTGLAPREPEVHGLAALMEFQASRMGARQGPNGEPVLLLDQNRARWDFVLIGRGLVALKTAQSLGGSTGIYSLQAAIAGCHAQARTAEETNWIRIAALYDVLSQVSPSPIIELNRALAVSMAYGPQAGLELVDALGDVPGLKEYHLLPGVRADLLNKLGRLSEAAVEYKRAANLTRNEAERKLMMARAAACLERAGSPE